jgi:hypothetical protein
MNIKRMSLNEHYKNSTTFCGKLKTKQRIFTCPFCPAKKIGQTSLRYHITLIHKKNCPSKFDKDGIPIGFFKNAKNHYVYLNPSHHHRFDFILEQE